MKVTTKLKELRKSRGIRQADVADTIGVERATYAGWELGRREPDYTNLVRLARFFEVSTDYLMNNTIEIQEPITVYSSILDGQPVYTQEHGWLLVNHEKEQCIDCNGNIIPFSELTQIYLCSQNDLPGILQLEKQLPLDELPNHKRVWVEPLLPDKDINSQLRGWYSVGEKAVSNDAGNFFLFAKYNSQWIAFGEKTPWWFLKRE